ncbi:MAG TPA: LPS export ABC transporter ATP-binding protein [Chitinophagaceae bacterium]|nr:LPS export ABC transporter ATP-binding protein [Chitinophagaceae bacterium]
MSLTIHTHDLIKSYCNRTVVNHVSVEVKQGEIVGLLGPNGAGKTTTFYMVVGLIRPDEGTVFLNDEDITRQPMYKRAQMGLGYLPQEASVFRKLSVEDNIKAILEMTKLGKLEQKTKLESLLDEFGLQHVRKNNGDSLSGGERRRTEIARALAVDPKFILLDEPFAGVDPIAVEDIQTVVARLKTKNIGILITDHNVNETLSICDRAYLLIEGKIFKHGTAEQLAEDEQVRRLYLGKNFELKRKDYLHEEARESIGEKKEINTGKLEITLKDAADTAQQIINDPAAFDEQNLNDFFQFLTEIKMTAIEFAEKNNRPKIKQTAQQIAALNFSDFIYDSNTAYMDSNSIDVAMLQDSMRDVQSYLSKLAMYVENEEFEKIG